MEDGDYITINYVGRVQDTGEIFDLTDQDTADEEGLNLDEPVEPVDVVVGANHVLPGLDDALTDMSVGDERTIRVDAENGFGTRDSDNIEKYSEKMFTDQDVNPRKGDVVDVDGKQGRVLYAKSGRILVDFNHPLAGEDLEYDVEILDKIEDEEAKVKRLCKDFGLDVDVTIDGDTCTITVPKRNDDAEDVVRNHVDAFTDVSTITFTTGEDTADTA